MKRSLSYHRLLYIHPYICIYIYPVPFPYTYSGSKCESLISTQSRIMTTSVFATFVHLYRPLEGTPPCPASRASEYPNYVVHSMVGIAGRKNQTHSDITIGTSPFCDLAPKSVKSDTERNLLFNHARTSIHLLSLINLGYARNGTSTVCWTSSLSFYSDETLGSGSTSFSSRLSGFWLFCLARLACEMVEISV